MDADEQFVCREGEGGFMEATRNWTMEREDKSPPAPPSLMASPLPCRARAPAQDEQEHGEMTRAGRATKGVRVGAKTMHVSGLRSRG